MNIADLPEEYQEQARRQMEAEEPKPVFKAENLSTKADDKAEKVLQNECEGLLRRRFIAFLHISFRGREKKGWPDLTFALNGRPIAIELKSASGRLSKEQVAMLTMMQENGWETYVLRSYDDVLNLVNGCDVTQWEAE